MDFEQYYFCLQGLTLNFLDDMVEILKFAKVGLFKDVVTSWSPAGEQLLLKKIPHTIGCKQCTYKKLKGGS